MKYIRTKEHIYKRLFIDRAIINECGYGTCDKELNPIGETIIKQADTIEELCDRFVMFCPNAHCRKIRVYETMHSISLYSKRDKRWNGNMVDKVYGAIWVFDSNGVPTLKPVAKMNDKGELELL